MRDVFFVRVLTVALSASIPCSQIVAQESKKAPSGAVSGRVMLGDKPVPHVVVMLIPSNPVVSNQRTPPARAITDDDGNYRLTKVPPGSYNLMPYTPAFGVANEASFGQPGKSVTVGEGEEVDRVDFSLTKGGVVTGRVIDGEGRPVIEQHVNLTRVDERGQRMLSSYFNPFMFSTDDRGVYRLYGLTPGRYKVSVGDAPDSGSVRFGFGGATYKRTFYPDVADEARATVIEVPAGGEATDVDIRLVGASKTFMATGRIVDADSGKPLPNLIYGFGALMGQQSTIGSYGWTNNRTNADGQFRIEGLNAGRYAAFVVATEQIDFYSEPAVFEVNDSDVSGLEIKVHRGSSITGAVVIEGSSDSDVLAKVSRLELRSFYQTQELSAPRVAPISISPDGSFRITGLQAGKVGITLANYPTPPKGFSLLRVERDGVMQRYGIEIGAGENVSGVRVVIGYGTGVVRGQIKIQGGEGPPDLRFRVLARRLDDERSVTPSTTPDIRGSFRFENLMAGQYEIEVQPMYVTTSYPAGPPAPGRLPQKTLAKQNITVADGAETEVTLTIDLGTKDKGSDN
jgi:protocatechuate 3,4-dioxygenase beta subunit